MADAPIQSDDPPLKRGRGRPSDYDPKFCDEIVNFCAKGFSITAFACSIDVTRDTLYEWEKTRPDFSDAIKRARTYRQVFWEQRLIDSSDPEREKMASGVAALTIFALKNTAPEEFSDDQRHHHFISGTVKVERVERLIIDAPTPAEPLLIEGEVIDADEVIDQAASEPLEEADP